ncbi:unnamed protein product [Nippostrongylus brasiliensis]|uniref:Plexin_cytopl domain-containing protein n=1 Tax=Nippostrongylus brasiliensis TaxID=27835 RepID=A0A0N4YZK6_NIPBR|nr:unnamed protein product [Nippostrongylus brasiliensis]
MAVAQKYHVLFAKHQFSLREAEVVTLFQEVRNNTETFDPKYFMSDDCNTFYNGFRHVFPQSRARKLLCLYLVLQAIKRSCTEKLKELELFALSKGSSGEDSEDMENVIALLDNVISVASDAVKKRHAKQQEALVR